MPASLHRPSPLPASRLRRVSALLLLLLAPLLPGCADAPAVVEDPIPKINDFHPATQPIKRGDPAQIIVHRAEIPHDANIDQAWTYVSLHGLDPKDVVSWRANGFRVGILDRQDLERFFKTLPPRDHDDATTWLTVPREMDPEPIIISEGLAPRRDVTFFLPPDTLRTESLPKGRYQFLLTAKELTDTPGMGVTVSPHLYYPNILFYARSPRETIRDGRVFKQLTLNSVIDSTHFLVIAIDSPIKLPPKPKPAPPPPPASQPAETQPKPQLIYPEFDPNPEAAPEPPRPALPQQATAPAPAPAPEPTPPPAPEAPAPEQAFPDKIEPTSSQVTPFDPTVQLAQTLQQEWKLADLILGVERFKTPYQAILVFEAVPPSESRQPQLQTVPNAKK